MIAYRDQTGPLAVAHRGGGGLAPENTLGAFRRAYALGIRCLETDVRLTRDGHLVAFHDATLRRVLGVRGRVGDRTLAELRQLPVLGGEAVAPLDEVLAAFPDARFIIDVKEQGTIAPLADLLTQTGAAPRVCAAAAWDPWLERLRDQVGDELTTALSWKALTRLVTRSRPPRRGATLGRFAHVPLRFGRIKIFADHLVERAADMGVRVVVWTVNDPATMNRLLDVYVHGVITDRPDLLREVLVARGQWRPPETYDASLNLPDLVS